MPCVLIIDILHLELSFSLNLIIQLETLKQNIYRCENTIKFIIYTKDFTSNLFPFCLKTGTIK